jgi:hypothetical protein
LRMPHAGHRTTTQAESSLIALSPDCQGEARDPRWLWPSLDVAGSSNIGAN